MVLKTIVGKNFRAVYILPKLINVLSFKSDITNFFCVVGDVTILGRMITVGRSSSYIIVIILSSEGTSSGIRAGAAG